MRVRLLHKRECVYTCARSASVIYLRPTSPRSAIIIKNINVKFNKVMEKQKKVTVKDIKTEKPQVTEHDIFLIVKDGENYKIACGNNYMSRMTFATVEEAKSYIDSKPWELVINTTCYVYSLTSKNSKK